MARPFHSKLEISNLVNNLWDGFHPIFVFTRLVVYSALKIPAVALNKIPLFY